jgi:hypothetical protein
MKKGGTSETPTILCFIEISDNEHKHKHELGLKT